MPKQTPDNFPINDHYDHFAAIDLTPEQISEYHPVKWERYDEDGLGEAAIAGFHSSTEGLYMLRHLYQAPRPSTTVLLKADIDNPESEIESIFEDFGFTSQQLIWITRKLTFHNFDLFRQDDNGGEFHVERFFFRPDASEKLRELAKGGHKQFYEIRKCDTDTKEFPVDSEGMVLT